MTYKVREEKELEYFLQTFEEASKHTRFLLFILLLSSVYVVVAAYTGDWQSETLNLPILDTEISRRWFFGISPIFILFNYVYFHLYLKDLIGRGQIFRDLDIECSLVEKRFLLFPWMLPPKKEDQDPKTRSLNSKFMLFCINLTFWWFGPAVLLAILMAYIFQQDIAALVPYVCFCLSILHYVMNSRVAKSKFKKFFMIYLSLFLFFITITAVPAIPEFFGVAKMEEDTFSIIIRFFFRAFFAIYFGIFAIPKEWNSEKPLKRKSIWIAGFSLGFIISVIGLLDLLLNDQNTFG